MRGTSRSLEPQRRRPGRRVTWETPDWLFNRLHAEFEFTLDVCATAESAKCPQYFTPQQDGLRQKWLGTCWCNPPSGRSIERWVRRGYESCKHHGSTVVLLLPVASETRWWHEWVMKASEIRFIRGRLRFGQAEQLAPFASAVVVFRPEQRRGMPLLGAIGD